MPSPFTLKTHILPASHPRHDFPTTVPSTPWTLSVSQYTPKNNPDPKEGDITILSAHGNGFPKELYEPLFEDLLARLQERGLRVRGVWIVGMAHMSTSHGSGDEKFGEEKENGNGEGGRKEKDVRKLNISQGVTHDSINTWDHTLDLLHVINTFRSQILSPIFGLGHSVGASHLLMLDLIHPGIMQSLILMEPIIVSSAIAGNARALAKFAVNRKREWGSRREAERYFGVGFQSWDSRVRERWMSCALIPSEKEGKGGKGVELAWKPEMEITSYLAFEHIHGADPDAEEDGITYARAPRLIHAKMGEMTGRYLILCGTEKGSIRKEVREEWEREIGKDKRFKRRGVEGKVEIRVLEGKGHLMPMEDPGICAEMAGRWIENEMGEWEKKMEGLRWWRGLGERGREERTGEWLKELRGKL